MCVCVCSCFLFKHRRSVHSSCSSFPPSYLSIRSMSYERATFSVVVVVVVRVSRPALVSDSLTINAGQKNTHKTLPDEEGRYIHSLPYRGQKCTNTVRRVGFLLGVAQIFDVFEFAERVTFSTPFLFLFPRLSSST